MWFGEYCTGSTSASTGQVSVGVVRVLLVFPHDSLVPVELFAGSTHDAILLAADVAAVRRLDGHLRVGAELEDERLRGSLVRVDTTVTFHRPILAVVT